VRIVGRARGAGVLDLTAGVEMRRETGNMPGWCKGRDTSCCAWGGQGYRTNKTMRERERKNERRRRKKRENSGRAGKGEREKEREGRREENSGNGRSREKGPVV